MDVISAAALPLDGEDALQGGGGDPQPLGHGDVIFHGLGHGAAADYQHMGAPKQVTAHVDAALMLLGDSVIEKQRVIQGRADGRESRIVHEAAILRRLLGVLTIAAAPCGGDIGKGSFHFEILRFCMVGGSTFSPRPFPVLEKGAALEDIPPSRLRK
ncbi:hypothetical protein QGA_1775 [Clostridioides difficile CD181]|nr:hypothetical protein QCA_1712 [Clostridioides difficile CD40]EQF54930.1 hypothetical protein QGA_1775 [Clostridioides difficile CD181]EQK61841.1 hypothetical protein C676_0479 [Clostridioides difficile F548]CCL63121.1 conserved hypothetical protein [Clostridioides difficile E9]CCL89750.1 conserved hypothetical protein [Clostridioides difficile T10]